LKLIFYFYYMFDLDYLARSGNSNSVISQSYSGSQNNKPISDGHLTEVDQKTSTVFSRFLDAVQAVNFKFICNFVTIGSRLQPDIYKGKRFTVTQNSCRASDESEYAKLLQTPYQLPKAISARIAERGYVDVPCSLTPLSKPGQCHGGVTLFLNKVLNGSNIQAIADEFKTGIPLPGVLQYQLYSQILQSNISIDIELLSVWNETCGESEKISGVEPTPNIAPDSRRENIVYAYRQYLLKYRQQPDSSLLESHIESINAFLKKNNQTELQPDEKVALNYIVSQCQCGTNPIERLSLEIWGLDVESQIEIAPDRDTPGGVLNRVEQLEPGAYKLSIPCYDVFGRKAGGHTIAFVVQEDGSTIFYDPNFSITEVKKEDRKKTMEKVFKYYAGSKGKNNSDVKGFVLLKVKLAPKTR
jgi:hypothetical protein